MADQEPKAMTREEREKAIKAKIRRHEVKRDKYLDLARKEDEEARALQQALRELVAGKLAEIDKEIGLAKAGLT